MYNKIYTSLITAGNAANYVGIASLFAEAHCYLCTHWCTGTTYLCDISRPFHVPSHMYILCYILWPQ